MCSWLYRTNFVKQVDWNVCQKVIAILKKMNIIKTNMFGLTRTKQQTHYFGWKTRFSNLKLNQMNVEQEDKRERERERVERDSKLMHGNFADSRSSHMGRWRWTNKKQWEQVSNQNTNANGLNLITDWISVWVKWFDEISVSHTHTHTHNRNRSLLVGFGVHFKLVRIRKLTCSIHTQTYTAHFRHEYWRRQQ